MADDPVEREVAEAVRAAQAAALEEREQRRAAEDRLIAERNAAQRAAEEAAEDGALEQALVLRPEGDAAAARTVPRETEPPPARPPQPGADGDEEP